MHVSQLELGVLELGDALAELNALLHVLYGCFESAFCNSERRGSDADIVVYDPRASHVIRADDCVANVDYNPYEGFVTAGGIRQVWLRGNLAVENGKVLDETPQGRYMARGKCSL